MIFWSANLQARRGISFEIFTMLATELMKTVNIDEDECVVILSEGLKHSTSTAPTAVQYC